MRHVSIYGLLRIYSTLKYNNLANESIIPLTAA